LWFVEQNQRGLMLLGQLQGRVAARGLGNDSHVGAFQQSLQAGAYNFVVIGD